jgi:hypothetical protein
MLMRLFGQIKLKDYMKIRRISAYSMVLIFALISASLTAIFGTYKNFIDARMWIYLFFSSVLIITTFTVSISFCQIMFGPLSFVAIGILQILNISTSQLDSPWAVLPVFYQLGRAMAMPNSVELIRCVLFGSCYNVGANVGVLIAIQVFMLLVLKFTIKLQFLKKIHGNEEMQKLGNILHATLHSNNHSAASIGLAVTVH